MDNDHPEFAEELKLFQEQLEETGEPENVIRPDPSSEKPEPNNPEAPEETHGPVAQKTKATTGLALELAGPDQINGPDDDNEDPESLLLKATSKQSLEKALQGGQALNKKALQEESSGLKGLEETLSLSSKIEALLFAAPKPLKISDIQEFLGEEGSDMRHILSLVENLMQMYREKGGGIHIVHFKGVGYHFQTVPAASALMETMFSQRPRPLSRAAHETLAIVAYRQPVTRADIEFIRGVDAGSIIKNLLERDLVACVGRKEDSPGKPMVFGTTEEFLKVYRFGSLKDLPPLESFQPAQDVIGKALDKIEAKQDVDVDELIRHAGGAKKEGLEASATEKAPV